MSHVPGLQLGGKRRLSLGPFAPPGPPRRAWLSRCCAAIAASPSPARLGKGPGEAQPRTRVQGRAPGGPSLGGFQHVGGRPGSQMRRVAGEPRLGRCREEERMGIPGGVRGREPPGEGPGAALLQEFPGIRLPRRRRGSGVRRGARRPRTGPPSPPPAALGPRRAAPAHTDPGPPGYGGAASTPSCRRVSAASSDCGNSPAPSHRRVCAGPGPPGRDSPPPFGGRGVSPAPSGLRDAPGPGDRGFAAAPGD